MLQTPSNLANTASGDVTALARSTSQRPEWMFVYGHGRYTDSQSDGQLRRGYVENLDWYTSSSNTYYRTLRSDYGASDAHTCSGDSGGPWKMQSIDFAPESGVQFGVHSAGNGSGACGEDDAYAAMVAYHDTWIEDRVDGNGSCSNDTHSVLPYLDTWDTVSISTKVCW